MTLDPLRDLLRRMTSEEVVVSSSQSVSWQAYREAERLTDERMVGELASLVRVSQSKDERRAAYFILGCIGRNTGTAAAAALLVERAAVESDKYMLQGLLDALAKLALAPALSLEPIYRHLNDSRWLVRHAAIRALSGASSPEAEEHVLALLAVTEDPHDKLYAHVTLGRIGTPRAIPFISPGAASRKRDVKISAEAAIQSIRARCGLAD